MFPKHLFKFKLDFMDPLPPSSDFLEFSICWLIFLHEPTHNHSKSRVARDKIIGGAEQVLLTPLEAWSDYMFCGKWAESSLTKGIMRKPDV